MRVPSVVLLIALAQPRAANAAELTVLCSNGMKAVMVELAAQFEKSTTHTITVRYDLSASLKRRLDAGEPFDIAILTPRLIDDAIQHGRIAGATSTIVARSSMALAIRSGGEKPDIRTTAALTRALLASPSLAYAREGASAVYFVELMRRLGLTERLKPKITLTTTGAEVGTAVARGDVQLGVLPVSEILPVAGIEVLGTFPADVQGDLIMVAGVSAGTTARAALARDFIAFLTAPEALPVLKSKGMTR